jgi:hypothetical protein
VACFGRRNGSLSLHSHIVSIRSLWCGTICIVKGIQGLFSSKMEDQGTLLSIPWHMKARGVVPIFWPPFSPDLSPIEAMWKRIKDILSLLSPEVHRSYERLRIAVIEAWDGITDAEVRDMIYSMAARCAVVIGAHGMYIEF